MAMNLLDTDWSFTAGSIKKLYEQLALVDVECDQSSLADYLSYIEQTCDVICATAGNTYYLPLPHIDNTLFSATVASRSPLYLECVLDSASTYNGAPGLSVCEYGTARPGVVLDHKQLWTEYLIAKVKRSTGCTYDDVLRRPLGETAVLYRCEPGITTLGQDWYFNSSGQLVANKQLGLMIGL